MRKLAVSLSKGGVGKTTTAVNLAAGLALAGERVLLVDTDTQGQVTQALGIEAEIGLAEVMMGESGLDEAMIEARENLWLLGGGKALAGVTRVISQKDFGGERSLAEALAPLDDRFDFVIVDTPPGWSSLTVNVLFYVTEVIAPVSMEVLTLQGLRDFSESLEAVQRYNEELELRFVVPTFYDRRVRKSMEIVELLETYYEPQLCAPIRYSVRLSEAPGYGQTIYEYASDSTGAADYLALMERIKANG